MSDGDRLRAVFGQEELAWLIDRLRRRILRGQALTGWVTLRAPSEAERRAIDRLLGRPRSRGKDVRLRLEDLEAELRHGGLTGGLRRAVESVTGPLDDERARRARREAAWDELLAKASERDARPPVRAWLEAPRTRTLLRRYSGRDPEQGRHLLDQAMEVLRHLPARGRLLAELAAELVADSHALDAGRPLGTLVIDAAARLGGGGDWHSAEGRVQIWGSVGVAKDDVSASVLCYALPAVGDGLCDRLLRTCAEAGEAGRLTTGQLFRQPPTLPPDPGPVYVVENPALVAAARRLGSACAPLVCTDGQPAVAVHALLTRLVEGGAELRYHGDFDWSGVRIFARLLRRYPMTPWRFSAADYLAAPPGVELEGKPADTPWDDGLRRAMEERGHAVHEEQVADLLLADLAASAH